ncbi:MAG TPA: hypothetical protein IAA20_09585 [Candidatus Enterococcus avicola]|uniref:DUF1002 domain-containing protein n=1 Tax=Candidatus Enterococcus avicola TaxID=2838561 RepID=A0A9D2F9B8_9ENTE|nr:hypothetical protein [Candidatus Enterococcus avicola]
MLKKILALAFASIILVSVLPITSFAAEKNPTNIIQVNELVKDEGVETLGFKKTILVNGLKYGGEIVGDLLSILSKKNGDLVKKNSYELGSKLEKLSNDIEQKMMKYMAEELEFSLSEARTIAWAINQFIF